MSVLVRRVRLRNYKSIASCDLALGSLMFLVGPNGSGKSNFLDSFRFVADSLTRGPDSALRERGGIDDVRLRSTGHPNHFSISLRLDLGNRVNGSFNFTIGASQDGGFVVLSESASLAEYNGTEIYYEIRNGQITRSSEDFQHHRPPILSDSFFLTAVSGSPRFRPLFNALTSMAIYNLSPPQIKELQLNDSGEILRGDGSNVASVIRRMTKEYSVSFERVLDYLSNIVPGVEKVSFKQSGTKGTVRFHMKLKGDASRWFDANTMSDGTLRSLGVLVALFQKSASGLPSLVGIEEPESTIHPGAVGVLVDAMIDASREKQIIATTHSPDLLDFKGVDADQIVAVKKEGGVSIVRHVDDASRNIIRDLLMTPGELLRQFQLEPDLAPLRPMTQADFFLDLES